MIMPSSNALPSSRICPNCQPSLIAGGRGVLPVHSLYMEMECHLNPEETLGMTLETPLL